MRTIAVSFLPEMLNPADLDGRVCIVVDLLRASTTIVRAIESGAACVVPCLTPQDALQLRAARKDQQVLLGGERGGLLIPGFDLGNSPSHYTPECVRGKTLVFTTTNGTKAIHAATRAHLVLMGCFSNVRAVAAAACSSLKPVHVVCAGTGGEITIEDCLVAGRIVRDLQGMGLTSGNDEAVMARELFENADRSPGGVLRVMRESSGGRNLAAIGLSADVDECAQQDTTGVVPVLDSTTGEIKAATRI